MAKKKNSPARAPQIGDIVKFYPADHDRMARTNESKVAPAIVTAVWTESLVNVRVFQDGIDTPLWRTAICHISHAVEGSSFWDY